jgi:hypothetical protein
MSDNVVQFRRIEKKPDPKPPRQKPRLPDWAPFAGLVAVAVVIYVLRQSGLLGGAQ